MRMAATLVIKSMFSLTFLWVCLVGRACTVWPRAFLFDASNSFGWRQHFAYLGVVYDLLNAVMRLVAEYVFTYS